MKIPSNIPYIDQAEEDAIREAIQNKHIVGNGPISKRVQAQMGEIFGVKHVLLTPSCTAALEMAMLALDIGPGDEVILPSFTFVSASNCVVLRGATPVFAEIKMDTLNIDVEDIRRKITTRTKAIMPMHYAGVSCEMDAIMELAEERGISVVEDAAQGVDALYKDRYLGTIGDMGCYSFHATKNITCGEGGAFLTNNDELAAKAEIIQEKGTNRAAFVRGQVDKYSWVSIGSSYILSDLLASVLEVQLQKRSEIKEARERIHNSYITALRPLAEKEIIQLPYIPEGRESNYHLFFFLVEDNPTRNKLLTCLRDQGVGATFHYVPLHSSSYGASLGTQEEDLLITEKLSSRLVRLPIYPGLTLDQVDEIAASVYDCLG